MYECAETSRAKDTYKDASTKRHTFIELLSAETFETVATKIDARRYNAHVWTLTQCILDHFLILFHHDRASTVHDIATCLRSRVHTVNRAKDELFLQL